MVFEALKSAGPDVFDAPIAFVCHSLGGIVLKQVLRHAEQSSADPYAVGLLENLSRVFFIATPHGGAAIASRATKYMGIAVNRVVSSLEKGHAHTVELGDWYREFSVARRSQFKNFVYYETEDTSLNAGWFQRLGGLARAKIVEKDSADPGLPGVTPVPLVGDHVAIAKPGTRQHLLYECVVRELNAMVDVPRRQRRATTTAIPAPVHTSDGSRWLKTAAIASGSTAIFALSALAVSFVTKAPVANPSVEMARPTPPPRIGARPEPQPAPKDVPSQTKDEEIERLRQEAIGAQKVREENERRVGEQRRRAEAEQQERLRLEEESKRADAERQERERLQEQQKAEEAAKAVVRQALAIQEGLRRAGCFRGPVSGQWGPLTKAAVAKYNKHAAKPIAVDQPTPEAETALLAVKGRVCPVACYPPRIEQNGACVQPPAAAGCPPGKADVGGGQCEAPYVAWVGADTTEAGAKALFAALQQRHADLLAARQLDIRARQNPDRFSVRIGPAAKREAAQDLCNRLRAAGLNGKCYPEPL